MSVDSVIVSISEDPDEQALIQETFAKLGVKNKVVSLYGPEEALDYLRKGEEILFILCDYSLPNMTGAELRQRMNEDDSLKLKAVPFVLLANSISKQLKQEVAPLQVQGLLKKAASLQELQTQLKLIYEIRQAVRRDG